MKRAVLFAVCFLSLMPLCGCQKEEQDAAETEKPETITVTFVNGVEEADVWILPMTEKNLKTSVWGKAVFPKVKTGESCQAPVEKTAEGGLYIFRMIDVDEMYYAANDVRLEEGWTVRIIQSDHYTVQLEVTDENGTLIDTHEVFWASL